MKNSNITNLDFSDAISLNLEWIPKPIFHKGNNMGFYIYEINHNNCCCIIHRIKIKGKYLEKGYGKYAIEIKKMNLKNIMN